MCVDTLDIPPTFADLISTGHVFWLYVYVVLLDCAQVAPLSQHRLNYPKIRAVEPVSHLFYPAIVEPDKLSEWLDNSDLTHVYNAFPFVLPNVRAFVPGLLFGFRGLWRGCVYLTQGLPLSVWRSAHFGYCVSSIFRTPHSKYFSAHVPAVLFYHKLHNQDCDNIRKAQKYAHLPADIDNFCRTAGMVLLSACF